jgi:hypothetical protein
MRGAIPPFPNTTSWLGAQLKAVLQNKFYWRKGNYKKELEASVVVVVVVVVVAAAAAAATITTIRMFELTFVPS